MAQAIKSINKRSPPSESSTHSPSLAPPNPFQKQFALSDSLKRGHI